MSLADDLRAAKALIDSPEKWRSIGTALAIKEACGHDLRRILNLRRSLSAQRNGIVVSHSNLMDLFDRAIASAGAQS